MKNAHITIVALMALILGGCMSASPQKINGKYYMGGDSNCRGYRIMSSSRIMCRNADGKDTGYRDAMTDQDMQMYLGNKAQSDRDDKERQRKSDDTYDKLQKENCKYLPKNTYGC